MSVIIEYHGKWLEWCICTVDGDVIEACFGSEGGCS